MKNLSTAFLRRLIYICGVIFIVVLAGFLGVQTPTRYVLAQTTTFTPPPIPSDCCIFTPPPLPTPAPTPTATPTPVPTFLTASPAALHFSGATALPQAVTMNDSTTGPTYTVQQVPVGIASAPASFIGNTVQIKPIAAGTAVFNISDGTQTVPVSIGVATSPPTPVPTPTPTPSPTPTPVPSPTPTAIGIVQTGPGVTQTIATSPGTLNCTLPVAPSAASQVFIFYFIDNGGGTDNDTGSGWPTGFTFAAAVAAPALGGFQAELIYGTGQTATTYPVTVLGDAPFFASCYAFEVKNANLTAPIGFAGTNFSTMANAGATIPGITVTPSVANTLTMNFFAWNDNGDVAAGTQQTGWTEQKLFNTTTTFASLEGQYLVNAAVGTPITGKIVNTTTSFTGPVNFQIGVNILPVGAPTPTPSPGPSVPTLANGGFVNGVETNLTTWQPFETSSPWNQKVAASPTLASYSANVIALQFTGATNNSGAFFSFQEAGGYNYGHPIYYASGTDPLINIICDTGITGYNDCGAIDNGGIPAQIRIPGKARTAGGTDSAITVIQSDGTQIDFWDALGYPGNPNYPNTPPNTYPNPPAPQSRNWITGDTFRAGNIVNCGSIYSNFGFLTFGPGATAGGQCNAGGQTTYKELASGVIHHALAVTLQCAVGGGVYPAIVGAMTDICASGIGVPLGGHLWYSVPDATTNAVTTCTSVGQGSCLWPWEKAILNAYHDYGGYFTDDGSGADHATGLPTPEMDEINTSALAFTTGDQILASGLLSQGNWTHLTAAQVGPLALGNRYQYNNENTWLPFGVNFARDFHWIADCRSVPSNCITGP